MIGIIALAASLAVTPMSAVKMNGWLVFDDNGDSFTSFKTHAPMLQSVSAVWMKCDIQGHIQRLPSPTADQKNELFQIARKNRVKVYGLIGNEGFDAKAFEVAVATPQAMSDHIATMVRFAKEDGLDGIDLDYESLGAKDRDLFSGFVQALGKACHASKLKLVIALHAKESEPGDWDGARAQDWAAIGQAVDMARVMTYDLHWDTGDAGPIASPDWVERVMTFATKVIPANKLDLGIPSYGYDWLGKKANDMTWTQWSDLVKAHGPAKRDPVSQELTLTYDNRTAFYSDGESCRQQYAIAKKLGLNGLAMWRLGAEDPAFWPLYASWAK